MTHAQSLTPEDPHAVLAALNLRLDGLVEAAGVDRWNATTPAEGWDVAMQIAHLTWTDEMSLTAIGDPETFAGIVESARANIARFVDEGAAEVAATGRDEVLSRWRMGRARLGDALKAADPGEKIPWFGPPMRSKSMTTARIMETWAHGTDVADALGIDLRADPAFVAALPHVAAIGYKTRAFSYANNSLDAPTTDIHVRLTGPEGVLEFGNADAEQRVTGPLLDFCLLVTQRVHRDDTGLETVGGDAEKWLQIAQAFAGPSGGGREKGSRA